MRELIAALKQRALVQWTVAYLAVAWLLLQLFSILADQFNWSATVERSFTVLLAVGVLVVLIVGWYHGEKGRQRISLVEVVMLTAVVILASAALRLARAAPDPESSTAEPAGPPLPSVPAARASIAVLPFANLSGHAEDDYFADGFTEQLIDALVNVRDLRVASRTSSFAFKGRQVEIGEVGKRLGVLHVLEGSVRRAGNRIRVTAQLINTADGFHVWSRTFERNAGDLFAVQDELSRALVQALDVSLNQNAGGAAPTHDLEAYDLYLRGLYHWRRTGFTSDSAIHYLRQATTRDPRFALAFGALGQAYQTRNFSAGDSTAEYREKAFIAIERALTLAPQQAQALVARGHMAYTIERGFDMEAAARDFRRAIEINPRLAHAHEALGALYHHVGLNERALREFRVAVELDPQSDFARFRIPRTLMYQGKYAEALTLMNARPDRDRNVHWQLALWYNGRKAEALTAARAHLAATNPLNEDVTSTYALILAGLGRNAEAEQYIAQAIRLGSGGNHFHHAAYSIASAYALMGRHAQAMEWLKRTAREGFPNYELFLTDPNLDSLRRDAQFRAFMQEQRARWEHFAKVL